MLNLGVKKILIIFLILSMVVLLFQSGQLKRQYKDNVAQGIEGTKGIEQEIIKEADIAHLPEPVQKYLRYVGVIGKEKVNNFRVSFRGEMKMDKDKDWSKINAQQYSFFGQNISRQFYINLSMSGIPIIGLHSYEDTTAKMLIKIAGLIPVVDEKGDRMNQAETVTVFNDMSILAPATLIDPRITWEPIDSLTTKATFDNNGVIVSATLYFNQDGQLVNFVSNDRYYLDGDEFKKVSWSTPILSYKKINGYNLADYAEATWDLPEGEFTYAKFHDIKIEYNVNTLK